MAVKVLMPKGSDTMTEGKVLKWLKKEGDQVLTGEGVVEIETDKVNMEVEAMGSGVLRKVMVDAGKVVPVGELLAVVAKPEEDIASLLSSEGSAGVTKGAQPSAGSAVGSPEPTSAPAPPAPGASPAALSARGPQMEDEFWPRRWPEEWLRKAASI